MKPYLQGVGPDYLDAFDGHWQEAWEAFPPSREALLLTICSHAKPYGKSYIHAMIRKHLYEAKLLDSLDYAHISNAGIVPMAAGYEWPFCAYDWDDRLCTDRDRLEHIMTTSQRLAWWYKRYGWCYPRGIYVYLRPVGHTMKGVDAARALIGKPVFSFSYVGAAAPMPYLEPDVDNVLTDYRNLMQLTGTIRNGLSRS